MDQTQLDPSRENSHQDCIAGSIKIYDTRSGNEEQATIYIWEQQILKIGRDTSTNTFSIGTDIDCLVSRNHCEFYVVVYETAINHIYVRDRKSSNGTYVNGTRIGAGPALTPGYLLNNGDVVEIRPHWKLKFFQTEQPSRRELTDTQKEECKVFEDRYLVTNRCLGEGAEASVHLAINATTKKQMVCKLVNLDRIRGRNARTQVQRKLQEVDILRQLQHPNILPYIDCISSSHSLYLFAELASGGDLMSFIYRHDLIPEFDSRIIMRQVVSGLSYLHSRGVVHRDLKPENILLAFSPRPLYHRIMLSDFGTSTVPFRNRMTSNVGTASYQAPELRNGSTQTSAVDIWSMGIVAFMLLVPMSEEELGSLNQVDQAVLDKGIKDLNNKYRPKKSFKGVHFVRRSLRISPDERLNANQAACHDWLCTPIKHKDFFDQLDKRILANWTRDNELKPMPIHLQNMVLDEDTDPKLSSKGILGDDPLPQTEAIHTTRFLESTPKYDHIPVELTMHYAQAAFWS